METSQYDFNAYAFSAQPDYDEKTVRKEFAKLMPLKTIVIYCFDPRAAGIPEAVAKEFGDTYPGEVITDADGNGIGTSATMLNVVVAGGRAMDALRSITVGQHLLGVENIVVVHHTHCGATSYTPEGIVAAFKHEHGADIAKTYPRESVAISDYAASLEYDTQLIRNAAGTPQHADIYGFVYDIETAALIRVTENPGNAQAGAKA